MKRITLALLAMLALCGVGQAKTIHWLTFIDTTDPSVGEVDVFGREYLYSHYINIINAAVNSEGYSQNIQDYYGARTSPENCKRAVEGLNVAPDDIVMFYYIGHGARSPQDPTPWPQLGLAQHDANKLIPLDWIHRTLKAKNPRLLVTIGMCCNSVINIPAKTSPMFSPNFGNTYLSDAETEIIKKLVLDYKGDVLLSSSSPAEPSRCLILRDGDKVIDAFTWCLSTQFENLRYGNINPDWNSFLDEVKDFTAECVNMVHHASQVPQFVGNLTPAPRQSAAPKAKPAPAPASTQEKKAVREQQKENNTRSNTESTDNRNDVINILSARFNTLIDTNRNADDRIALIEQFESDFPEILDVTVKTIGQDGNTVVGKQSMSDFVGRIGTSRILRGISVEDVGSEVKVKEIYAK